MIPSNLQEPESQEMLSKRRPGMIYFATSKAQKEGQHRVRSRKATLVAARGQDGGALPQYDRRRDEGKGAIRLSYQVDDREARQGDRDRRESGRPGEGGKSPLGFLPAMGVGLR